MIACILRKKQMRCFLASQLSLRQVCVSYQDIRLLLALAAGLAGPAAAAPAPKPSSSTTEGVERSPAATSAAPSKAVAASSSKGDRRDTASSGGGLGLRVGLMALRLKVFNDCPGFRRALSLRPEMCLHPAMVRMPSPCARRATGYPPSALHSLDSSPIRCA